MSRLGRHRAVALLALAGVFLSAYLLLHRLGVYGGGLLCGPGGGCDLVQGSRWAVFLGVPVAGWGLAWYAAVFLVAMIAAHGRRDEGEVGSGRTGRRWPDRALAGLALAGLAFTLYLTGLELFVIGAICRWCVGSAVLVAAICLCLVPWNRLRRAAA